MCINWLVQNWERSMTRLYIVILFILLLCRVQHAKCLAGWITSWNQQLQICRWYHCNGRKWRGIKEPLDEVEREWKSWLKIILSNIIQFHHFMANRWWKSGSSDRSYFLGLQNHCKWWLQPWNKKTLAPWKKNHGKSRQCIKKQKHHFVDKGLYSQSYDFSSSPVWMWPFHHKKRLKAEELMLLNCGIGEDTWVPWTKRRSNQSILKEINPEYSLEALLLKL